MTLSAMAVGKKEKVEEEKNEDMELVHDCRVITKEIKE